MVFADTHYVYKTKTIAAGFNFPDLAYAEAASAPGLLRSGDQAGRDTLEFHFGNIGARCPGSPQPELFPTSNRRSHLDAAVQLTPRMQLHPN